MAAYSGEVQSNYKLEIKEIRDVGDTLEVRVESGAVPAGTIASVPFYRSHIIKLSKTEKKIVWTNVRPYVNPKEPPKP